MRILGIDPGMAIVGYGVIDYDKDICGCESCKLVDSGSIQTSKNNTNAARLLEISQDLEFLIEKFKPDMASVEKLFFFKNAKTVMPVAEARGVILMTLEKYGIKTCEYTPLEVKQTITGYGRAEKEEVCQMVKILIGEENMPKLDDTTDAIAIALCQTRHCE